MYEALALRPVGREGGPQYDTKPPNPSEFQGKSFEAVECDDRRVTVPSWTRTSEAGTPADPDLPFQPVRPDETRHWVATRKTDEIDHLYLLRYPDLLLGIPYYNERVNWTERSERVLEEQGFDRVLDLSSEVGTSVPRKLDAAAEIRQEFAEFDRLLRQSVRDLRADVRSEVHERLIKGEHATAFASLAEQLRDPWELTRIDADPSLRIRVGPENGRLDTTDSGRFHRIVYDPDEGPSLSLAESQLLWDCACERSGYTTDRGCAIHDGTHSAVTRAFESELVGIEYDGVEFLWWNAPDLWPPSMDSIRFLETVDDEIAAESDSLFDLGTGTGVLATLLGRRHQLTEIVLSDWLVQPTVLAATNLVRELGTGDPTVDRFEGPTIRPTVSFGTDTVSDGPVADLCVCNPPYLPILDDYPDLRYEQAVAGTRLLESVIRRAPALGETVYLNFSNLARPEVDDAVADSSAQFEELSDASDWVPFRVPPALDHGT
ncbi:MAG: hypothetical protein ABEI99_00315, partial [Halobaculum sp.]